MNEIAGPVLVAIDDVWAIVEEKGRAGETDHATDPKLEETVGTFLATFEEHMPQPRQEAAPLQQLLYLEVWLDSRGEATPCTSQAISNHLITKLSPPRLQLFERSGTSVAQAKKRPSQRDRWHWFQRTRVPSRCRA